MSMFSISTFRAAFRNVAAASRPAYWGDCPRCDRSTPWHTNALLGQYRCRRCGTDPVRGGRPSATSL